MRAITTAFCFVGRKTVFTSGELSTRKHLIQLLEQVQKLDLELHASYRLLRQNCFDASNRDVLYAAMAVRDDLGRELLTSISAELGQAARVNARG
jgi:hypothetical protein